MIPVEDLATRLCIENKYIELVRFIRETDQDVMRQMRLQNEYIVLSSCIIETSSGLNQSNA